MEYSNTPKVQEYEVVMTHSQYGMKGIKIISTRYQEIPDKDKVLFKKV
jgi:hypothetical protein